jgi:hypothetical protein
MKVAIQPSEVRVAQNWQIDKTYPLIPLFKRPSTLFIIEHDQFFKALKKARRGTTWK